MVLAIISPIVIDSIKRMLDMVLKYIFSDRSSTTKGVVVKYEYIYSPKAGFDQKPDDVNNKLLCDAIAYRVQKHKIYSASMECKLIKPEDYNNNVYNERGGVHNSISHIIMTPREEITVDDIHITFSRREKLPDGGQESSSNGTVSEKCVLRSDLGTKHIERFIADCYDEYKPILMKIPPPGSVFMQQAMNATLFSCYNSENTTHFDDLFFDEKQDLLNVLDDYMCKSQHRRKVKKVNLLLHGLPGCGKSSIIKAIADRTGYAVIVVKLSYLTSDAQLFSIFYDQFIHTDTKSGGAFVPLNNRIYVFEDIDAETDVVFKRDAATKAMNTTPDVNMTTSVISAVSSCMKPDPKITLSGVLNALDGVVDFNSIVIMTTNHPEKLDPALVRFGRFNMKIELRRMSSANATALIQSYYPEYSGQLPDDLVTPAALYSYITVSRNIEHLQKMIDAHDPDTI